MDMRTLVCDYFPLTISCICRVRGGRLMSINHARLCLPLDDLHGFKRAHRRPVYKPLPYDVSMLLFLNFFPSEIRQITDGFFACIIKRKPASGRDKINPVQAAIEEKFGLRQRGFLPRLKHDVPQMRSK